MLILIVLAALSWDGCTATSLGNAPLAHWEPAEPSTTVAPGSRSDELLLVLAFSGGGTRAAAFAYGVLEELAATPVMLGGKSRRLLDEVDLISGVSGGSFTAAYYGLYGDRIFRDFEAGFLKRPVERDLVLQLFRPRNWVRLVSLYFNRSQLAAEYYDEHLFHGATFTDLEHRDGPEILINATDLSTGGRFAFNRFFFDPICSDFSRYRVALAVTASSAVPVLLTPVTLENRAGECGYQVPTLPTVADGQTDGAARLRVIERSRASYLDRARRRFIHLMDGGISDNLGLRGLYERVLLDGGIENTLRMSGNAGVRDIVVISVNAQTEPAFNWDLENVSPSLPAVLDAVTSVQINRYNFETVALLQAAFAQWSRALSTEGHPVLFHFVSVSFDDLRDEGELRYFNELPTSFELEAKAVDRLRGAARSLLRESPEFRALREKLTSPPGSP
ncbi:MAG: patatin-like phospholipase family protein [Candidatus Rokuibacteriota bacterium]